MKKNSAVNVAVGGLISACALVLMLFAGIFPYGTYALPLFAGVLLIPIYVEFGAYWALIVYVAVSILSLILVADKEAAVLFTLFFGYFPVLKAYIEKLKSLVLKYLIKFVIFNIAAVSSYFIMLFIFNMNSDDFTVLGVNIPLVLLAVGNILFLIYDKCLTICVSIYFSKYRAILWKHR